MMIHARIEEHLRTRTNGDQQRNSTEIEEETRILGSIQHLQAEAAAAAEKSADEEIVAKVCVCVYFVSLFFLFFFFFYTVHTQTNS
jgi:predicted GTPase